MSSCPSHAMRYQRPQPAANIFLATLLCCQGGVNFLSLYSGILTLRILLSWFPQAQGVALLRPVFTVSDVYLNLFRGVVPPIGAPHRTPGFEPDLLSE